MQDILKLENDIAQKDLNSGAFVKIVTHITCRQPTHLSWFLALILAYMKI